MNIMNCRNSLCLYLAVMIPAILLPGRYAHAGSHHLEGAPPPGTVAYKVVNLTRDYFRYLRASDLQNLATVFHPQSPVRDQQLKALEALFIKRSLSHKMLEMNVVGESAEFSFARLKKKTERMDGEPYRSNVADIVLIFKKDGEKWKLWDAHTFRIRYLD